MHRRAFIAIAGTAIAGTALAAPSVSTAAEPPIRLRDLYNKDQSFSDLALSLDGSRIDVNGFMAPPLKADTRFFVLTKMPMAVCPFCESEAQWPSDIVTIYAKRRIRVLPFNVPLTTTGILALGAYTDPDLGFVSRVRLTDAVYGRA